MSVFYYKYTEDGGIQKIHKITLKGIKRCKIANNDTGISRFFSYLLFPRKTERGKIKNSYCTANGIGADKRIKTQFFSFFPCQKKDDMYL